jgi:S1-C subfamily serine protease
LAIAIIAFAILAGGLGYWAGTQNASSTQSNLQKQVTALQDQVASLQNQISSSTSSSTTTGDEVSPQNVSLTQLYLEVQNSVVVITDTQSGSLVEGSGFVYNLSGRMVVVTNNHVIASGTGISVTFENGDGYAATVLGADPYADLAVLSVTNAPASEYLPLQVVPSSSLTVGDFVAAVGSPFGLAGSMTTGIVSALGRTITETTAGNYEIADVIQFSAPINPGNSGGPLLNAEGQVVGINTAGIENTQEGGTAQGVGFAIPSDTILREVADLADTGSYSAYPYMGIGVVDMTYDIAFQEGLGVTYGVLVQQVTSGGPADQAGIKAGSTQATIDGETIVVGGDIITAINGTRIIDGDALSTYLIENTLPNQTINITIVRNGQTINVPLVLGTRPAAN